MADEVLIARAVAFAVEQVAGSDYADPSPAAHALDGAELDVTDETRPECVVLAADGFAYRVSVECLGYWDDVLDAAPAPTPDETPQRARE